MCQYKMSIIIPVYNGMNDIPFAIESFVSQNNSEIELIIVNDGSTDQTDLVCKKLSYNHDNIKYICVENGGAGRARNIGIQNASGDIIGFLDADDMLLFGGLNKDRCDTIFKLIMLDNNDIVYASKIKATYDLKTILQIESQKNEIRNHLPDLEFWSAFYRKDFLLKNTIQFYEYRKQDIETAFRYLCNLYASKYVVLPNFYFIVQRDNMQSNTHTWNKQVLYSVKARVCLDLLSRTPCEADKYVLYGMALDCVYNWLNEILLYGESEAIDNAGKFKIVCSLLMKYRKQYFTPKENNIKRLLKINWGGVILALKMTKPIPQIKKEILNTYVSADKADIKNKWIELSKKFLDLS